MNRPLSIREVADNLAPFHPHVEVRTTEPAGASSSPVGSHLQRDYNRTRAHDAIHSYLIEVADYDQSLTEPAYRRAIYMLERIAEALADKGQAEQDTAR